MKDAGGKIIYIGKAVNLKRRVSSYFNRPHDYRIQKLVSEIEKIDYRQTDSALEALILESALIKKHQPQYNIKEKDDKSFLYVEITREKFPRVLLVRGKDLKAISPASPAGGYKLRSIYGPFVSSSQLREALKIIRKIFPYSTHPADKIGKFSRPCFEYEIGLCPGTCIAAIGSADYVKNIHNIRLVFQGKKGRILSSLKKEMKAASKSLNFEKADKIKRQIFGLEHVRDVSLISKDFIFEPLSAKSYKLTDKHRIEGFDLSNISGTSAVGSMVVFTNGEPDKKEYRKFRIRSVIGANDIAMMEEILRRRFENKWQKPDLVLVDGGIGQVNVAESILKEYELDIPVVGLAKGPERKRNDLVGKLPAGYDLATLIKVRDEAHRFAIGYHKKVRAKNFLGWRS